jgi:hypothetical protein
MSRKGIAGRGNACGGINSGVTIYHDDRDRDRDTATTTATAAATAVPRQMARREWSRS